MTPTCDDCGATATSEHIMLIAESSTAHATDCPRHLSAHLGYAIATAPWRELYRARCSADPRATIIAAAACIDAIAGSDGPAVFDVDEFGLRIVRDDDAIVTWSPDLAEMIQISDGVGQWTAATGFKPGDLPAATDIAFMLLDAASPGSLADRMCDSA